MKRIIYILMVIITLSMAFAIDYSVQTKDFGLIEITISKKSLVPGMEAIVVNPNTLKPGERGQVILGVEIPDCPTSSYPGKTGKWELDFTYGNSLLQRMVLQDYCGSDSSSAFCSNLDCAAGYEVIIEFSMPSEGDYGVQHAIWNNDRGFLIPYEKTYFSVVEEVTSCTQESYWGDWQITYTILNGRYMSRPFYTISGPPSCEGSITNWERKTICDSGYLIEGSSVREASGLHDCVLVPCVPNWDCGAWGDCVNDFERRICTDGCGDSREETQGCTSCVPNWQCGEWSDCINGEKTQQCTDGCGGISITTDTCQVTPDCIDDIFYECPGGQTIVIAECIDGKPIETDQQCPDEPNQICNNDGTCDIAAQETYLNCPNDCKKPEVKCDKYWYLESGVCKLDTDLIFDEYGSYMMLVGGALFIIYIIKNKR